ncbi:MAG TPA: AbrB/MazE/SpoVT family DNA-binding domain-containing protein [Thermoflexia bacterium]|jgi:AbrB family looped-hinge helix DNA binding protein|nr:AbrB/MazE/SpoVT family DNA-binding domain-containing protein [Thermoflexia bacterium]
MSTRSTVSSRGQTVIPRTIRERMGIVPHSKLEWRIEGDLLIVRPIPPDPVRAAVGLLAETGPTTEELLKERRQEREKEAA